MYGTTRTTTATATLPQNLILVKIKIITNNSVVVLFNFWVSRETERSSNRKKEWFGDLTVLFPPGWAGLAGLGNCTVLLSYHLLLFSRAFFSYFVRASSRPRSRLWELRPVWSVSSWAPDAMMRMLACGCCCRRSIIIFSSSLSQNTKQIVRPYSVRPKEEHYGRRPDANGIDWRLVRTPRSVRSYYARQNRRRTPHGKKNTMVGGQTWKTPSSAKSSRYTPYTTLYSTVVVVVVQEPSRYLSLSCEVLLVKKSAPASKLNSRLNIEQ